MQLAAPPIAVPASAVVPPARPAPELTFEVPADMSEAFTEARARARRDSSEWLAANPNGSALEFRDYIAGKAGGPPTGAALEADHAAIVAAVAARTPTHDAEALWIDEHGLFIPWEAARSEYVARVGAVQARAGIELLDRAVGYTGTLTFPIKDRFVRQRPFQAHADAPLLDGITHIRGGSFPSGHASLAFAQAEVLASLLPDQAASLMRQAEQISYARPYGAAHYPSDVVTGAYVGAATVAFVQARPDAELPPPGPPPPPSPHT